MTITIETIITILPSIAALVSAVMMVISSFTNMKKVFKKFEEDRKMQEAILLLQQGIQQIYEAQHDQDARMKELEKMILKVKR